MTSNRKPEDQFEVIEEGMVENMMLEQEVGSDGSGEDRRARVSSRFDDSSAGTDDDSEEERDRDSDDTDRSGPASRAGSASKGRPTTSTNDKSRTDVTASNRKISGEGSGGCRAKKTTVTSKNAAAAVDKTANKSSSTSPDVANDPSASVNARRMTDEGSDFCLSVESDDHNDAQTNVSDDLLVVSVNDSEEPIDEMDTSDVSSSFAESESIGDVSTKNKLSSLSSSSSSKKPRKRQPPIMIGYKKRRKVTHSKKLEDECPQNGLDCVRVSEADESVADDGSSHHAFESSSSEENLFEGINAAVRPLPNRRSSSTTNEPSDKFCWTCHRDAGVVVQCMACPRAFHPKCFQQVTGIDTQRTVEAVHLCMECVTVLRADNINTRSPTLATVNLDQLCVSLKHVIHLLKAQKDAHYFLGPVDTKEFPHYREYVTHPMDLTMLEKNVHNKLYGCTEAFLADVKWIVHNSIVFNSKASKITNVAKNLLKICKREIAEIETCAECYYNSLVRIDTWFIEVCKRPHILVWARLKGYPPWPAKALKCKDNMVDCRFFGAHDRAWVPLKDCFLYSETPPQPAKIKKSNHLELGIQELERHIFKLKDKFGIFKYPPPRTPYQPANELHQIKLMLPNYDPNTVGLLSTKYLIHPDRMKRSHTPKNLFDDEENASAKTDNDTDAEKRLDDVDGEESAGTRDRDKLTKVSAPAPDGSTDSDISTSSSENELPAAIVPSFRARQHHIVYTSPPPSPPSSKKSDETAKSSSEESGSKPRRYVVVKNIDSINATVGGRKEASETGSKVSSSTGAAKVDSAASPAAAAAAAARANAHSSGTPTSVAPKATTTTTPTPTTTTATPRSVLLSKMLAPRKSSVENGSKDASGGTSATAKGRKESDQFDLDKVKEEPVDVDSNGLDVEPAGVERVSKKPTKGLQSLFTLPIKSKRAASNEENVAATAKKLRPDSNSGATTSSVNLSKTVTLSVVNQVATSADERRLKIVNVKPVTTAPPPSSKIAVQLGSGNCVTSEAGKDLPINAVVRSKSTPSPSPVARVVANAATPPQSGARLSSRSLMKILPRPQSAVTLTNGPTSVVAAAPQPSNCVPVHAVKDTSNGTANTSKEDSTSSTQSIQGLDEILLNEYQTHFKKFFEDTLDKIGGRGDLRAKIIGLQKEIETIKRSNELFVDELRREYETQIAELRATSIAKTQFDLAAERLKFEQEKEKAVKEAKSKQWCSNCQKSANYYCCWNTAYCDFECQKEHWISHMHVCKNDVKKKAAESSENEPPRIMMQNDVSNNYILNGYDKPGTVTASYAYQNSNSVTAASRNVKRAPTKLTVSKAGHYRPLLPRISSTTNTSSLSSPSVSAVSSSHLTNSTQSFSENSTYPAVSSTSSLRSAQSSTSGRQTTQQFHK